MQQPIATLIRDNNLIYALKKKNGDIGEYYFAYWVTKYFGWPCRLLDIDLGLDAQVEICNPKHNAIGKFIAVQIKSTQSNKKSVSLHLDNLKYWKAMEEPVIVARIINVTKVPEIYWKIVNTKSIDKLIKKAEKNKEKKTTLNFSDNDCLTKEHKEEFRLLPALKNIEILEAQSKKVKEKFEEGVLPFYDVQEKEYNMNTIGCDDDFIENFDSLCFDMDTVKNCEFFDEIIDNFYNRLIEYPKLVEVFEVYKNLAITYIRSLKHNSKLDVLQRWKEHPYHSDLAYIVNNN